MYIFVNSLRNKCTSFILANWEAVFLFNKNTWYTFEVLLNTQNKNEKTKQKKNGMIFLGQKIEKNQ